MQDFEIVQQVVAQIAYRTNIKLFDKLDNEESRLLVEFAQKRIKKNEKNINGPQ